MTRKELNAPPECGSEEVLTLRCLTKIFGKNTGEVQKLIEDGVGKEELFSQTGATVAVRDVSFSVRQGEFLALIGLSGSGKSTLIRMLNGLIRPTAGEVCFCGTRIDCLRKKEMREYRRRNVSMVFQNFGLMSHRNVLENVAFGLEVRGVKRAEREEKAAEYLTLVGLKGQEHAPIESLSGGMMQRVGLARALANEPDILLMDEPFSAVDPLVRSNLQQELLSIQKELEKTIIFITHDINEAFYLGDRVAIMQDGRVVQLAAPEEMFVHPATDYVQRFINTADRTRLSAQGRLKT